MNNFERISIIGNGLSAWMICAVMAKQLQGTGTKITLYRGVKAEETEAIQSPLPFINDFFKAINLPSDIAFKRLNSHPKLGTAYLFEQHPPFFHVWGQYGAPKGMVEFHQIIIRYMQANQAVDLNRLSIGSASVLAGKFKIPSQNQDSIYSTYEASWSFDTESFLKLLTSICVDQGVEINDEAVTGLEFSDRVYVRCEAAEPYRSDYLINTVPGLAGDEQVIESWFDSLPVMLKQRETRANSISKLVNKVSLIDSSSWLCDVTHRNGVVRSIYQFVDKDSGYVYVNAKSRHPRYLSFGPAMAKLYSPLISDMDLNLIAIKLLMRYFPSPSDGLSVSNEFNRQLNEAFENLRDVTQLCLISLFEKSKKERPTINLSEKAKYKINLFKCRGRYPLFENEFFKTEWQIWLLLGLGFKPDQVEPMALLVDAAAVNEHVQRVESTVLRELQSAPLIG